jgi:ATP-dependent RNA helicase DeaD
MSLETPESDLSELLGPALASALTKKGYTNLTPVQQSVLDPKLRGSDLRISSQTGSGKTLAIGFALRDEVTAELTAGAKASAPRALIIVPTRELAKQVHEELSWLFAPLKLRIASVTGGTSYRDEHRALAQGPAIVVGTPGRLLDHMNRGGVDASQIKAVVLDEADRMLDLGFRDELEAILALAPSERRTHLVSATFAREVNALADRVQKNAVRVEGTPLGTANADIDHVIHLVSPRERLDALVNLLLDQPGEQTLIFARTRADVADITRALQDAGFPVGSLSGEMEQQARTRALSAFKRGDMRALVATDVAARGIDVQDIGRVIQVDPPSDVDTYTHRSGRTGRAGRKGTSALLIPPIALRRAVSLLQRAGVRYRIEPVPSAASIRAAQDERWFAELTRETEEEIPAHVQGKLRRIFAEGLAERALALLLSRDHQAASAPRDITLISPDRDRRRNDRNDRNDRYERSDRSRGEASERSHRGEASERSHRGEASERSERKGPSDRLTSPTRAPRAPSQDTMRREPEQWVPFRISWGEAHGADARRLVAMLCRRGNIRGTDIGAIRVSRTFSNVEVSAHVARAFAQATRDPDPRDPRVSVTAVHDEAAAPRREKPSKVAAAEPAPARREHSIKTKAAGATAPRRRVVVQSAPVGGSTPPKRTRKKIVSRDQS